MEGRKSLALHRPQLSLHEQSLAIVHQADEAYVWKLSFQFPHTTQQT